MLLRLARIVERLALIVLLIGGLGLVLSSLLGVADVVGTQGFNAPIPGVREITESTMVLIVFGALAYTQVRRAHIRVELIYLQCGGRARAALDVIAHSLALLFFGVMLWQGVGEALFSWQINESTFGLVRFPLYPARIILVAGLSLMMLRLAIDLVIDIGRLRTGAPPPGEDNPILAD